MDAKIPQKILEALQKIKNKEFDSAESLLNVGIEESRASSSKQEEALYESTIGVLFKIKGEARTAWRHYEKAEKLLPGDPSLKIIVAKFLIDQFAQYDTGIKKMKKVLALAKGVPSFEHQAHAILALCYLKKGDRKKAVESLRASMKDDFQRLASSHNVNLDVIQAFVARNFEPDLCQNYLENAFRLAQAHHETKMAEFYEKLLKGFKTETTKT